MVRTYGANNGSLGGVFAQNKVRLFNQNFGLLPKCCQKLFTFAIEICVVCKLCVDLDKTEWKIGQKATWQINKIFCYNISPFCYI